jgi:hypothetical protein
MDDKFLESTERANKYRQEMGNCPECGSATGLNDLDIMYGFVMMYRKMKCNDCKKIFRLQYHLEIMSVVEEGDELT